MACEILVFVFWQQPARGVEGFRVGEDVSLAVDEVGLRGYDGLDRYVSIVLNLGRQGLET